MNVKQFLSNLFGFSSLRGRMFTISNPGIAGPSEGLKLINNNPPVYADPKTEKLIRDGFGGNASVYTIVSKASKKFGHINRGVYAIEDEKSYRKYINLCKAGLSTKESLLNASRHRNKAFKDELVSGKLSDLIARPNKWQGQDSFFELASVMRKVTGETFIWLNRGDVDPEMDDSAVAKMPVLEMYILPSNLIEIIPDLVDPWDILGYYFDIYGPHGSRLFIRKCDMIHWRSVNPFFNGGNYREHLRGMSPLKPGYKVLTQDDDSTDATVAMYQNGGAKAVLFDKGLAKLTQTQESQLREVVDGKINNKNMKSAVAALQGDWGMLDLGLTSVEMDLLAGGDQAFHRLCLLLDVPPAMFALDQTYENKSAAIKDWLLNSVIPDACSLADEMNRVLLPAFGITGKIKIDNDISDIPELQEDLGKLVAWMNLMPWMTPNEKREYLGEERSDEDGMDEVWVPNNLVKLSDAGMPDVTAPLDSEGMNDYNNAVKPKPAKVGN